MLLVDGSVPVADFQGLVTRVRGGSYDPATGQVSDPGVRHLVFNRGGQLVRVSFDRSGSSPPTPVRLSTETAALRLTRNFIQIVPHSGTLITSVNKSDGRLVQADMPAGGLVRQWLNTGLVGPATSDRLFDWRNTGTRNLVGSIRADGSERRARQAARRLHAQHRAAGPAAVEQPGALSVSGHRVRRGTTLTSARTCCPLP